MAVNWQEPEDWTKDGSTISDVAGLKTGAWTALYTAKEVKSGKSVDILVKTFTVPDASLHDAAKIAAEKARFLNSATLQQSLAKEGAAAWVSIYKISTDPPSYTMAKCGPSLKDLQDHKVSLSAKELYGVLQGILQGLMELESRQHRSHGDLKASNVLCSLPGEQPPCKLADPTPRGEVHWANDLYNLGLILYELIEHKPYDPITQITPSKNWARLGARRDRWIQFLHLLLSPNGCQDSLADVKKEARRLKPVSPLRPVFIAAGGLVAVGALAVGYHELALRMNPRTIVRTVTTSPAVDPEVKAAYEQEHQAYQEARQRWTDAVAGRTLRYDHTQSLALARESRTLVDGISLTDQAAYRKAAGVYQQATEKLNDAIVQAAKEEAAGKSADEAGEADFAKIRENYAGAQKRWAAAAAKFAPGENHVQSRALAEAAQPQAPPMDAASDPAARRLAAAQYKTATEKLEQALAMIPEEDQLAKAHQDALAAFQKASEDFHKQRALWEAFEAGHANLDLAAARKIADDARGEVEQIVLTDDASYRAAAERSRQATAKMGQALALARQARPVAEVVKVPETRPAVTTKPENPDSGVPARSVSPAEMREAIAKADTALKARNYPQAFALYKDAAAMGSPAAMCNVGLFYETGAGTAQDFTQAAVWYKKAADRDYVPGLRNLASLYQRGKGVDQDFTQAFALYKKAAELHNADAMVSLGQMLENGQGVAQDFSQALEWYKKAAELHNMAAITDVGVFYEEGRGVPADYREAASWYEKGAALNYPPAMNALASLYDAGKYENGKDVKPDHTQAFKWYAKAAELGYAPAMCNLGALYDNGQGVALDHTQAFKWFSKAAELNHPMAMYNLGVLYEMGRGTALDHGEAITWYRKAAHSADPTAQRLGLDALTRLGFSP